MSENIYAIPAIGISVPITNTLPLWRFGLAAYGVSGLGVDYRNTALDQPRFTGYGGYPLVSGDLLRSREVLSVSRLFLVPIRKGSLIS